MSVCIKNQIQNMNIVIGFAILAKLDLIIFFVCVFHDIGNPFEYIISIHLLILLSFESRINQSIGMIQQLPTFSTAIFLQIYYALYSFSLMSFPRISWRLLASYSRGEPTAGLCVESTFLLPPMIPFSSSRRPTYVLEMTFDRCFSLS